MARCIGCWLLCSVALIWIGGLAAADKSAKDGKPAAKGAEPAAKKSEPAAKKSDPATKKGKSAAKGEPAAKETEPSAAPATYTVKKGPLKVTVDLDGVFEAEKAQEIFVKPEEWTTLVVQSAVAHGAQVRKGDVLLKLDTEKLDHAIAELRSELGVSEVVIQQSEEQLQAMEKITPLDLEASQRSARTAEEDRKFFLDVDRPFALKATEFNLKVAKETLEYEEEELRQLEKMYKANDITEETEQIVLKRARDTVDRAKFAVEYATINHDQALKLSIPRVEEHVKELAQRQKLDWEKEKIELPLTVQKQRMELKKLQVQRERADERLKRLLDDRELLTVKSPIDGIVYYGKCVRGKFSDSGSLAESLRPNGVIASNQVVMTVVQPRPLFVQTTVPEEQLHRLRPGLKGIATPTGYPELRLPATVDRVSDIPTASTSFDARLNVVLDRKAKWLMPGMTCKVKLVPYLKKDAISVPLTAVETDKLDEQKHFVYVSQKDGKPKKQAVTLGEKTEKQAEILQGLAEGDKVLREPPEDEK